jgi:hypothetical protein
MPRPVLRPAPRASSPLHAYRLSCPPPGTAASALHGGTPRPAPLLATRPSVHPRVSPRPCPPLKPRASQPRHATRPFSLRRRLQAPARPPASRAPPPRFRTPLPCPFATTRPPSRSRDTPACTPHPPPRRSSRRPRSPPSLMFPQRRRSPPAASERPTGVLHVNSSAKRRLGPIRRRGWRPAAAESQRPRPSPTPAEETSGPAE